MRHHEHANLLAMKGAQASHRCGEAGALYREKFADQEVSFTDCISFVLMRSNRLERAFTFNRRFASAGFEIMPKG